MKRLNRFVLLTLGYLIAVVRVAARRLPKRATRSRIPRRRLGMLSGAGLALLGLVVAGNLLSPPATSVKSASSSSAVEPVVSVTEVRVAPVVRFEFPRLKPSISAEQRQFLSVLVETRVSGVARTLARVERQP